MQTDIVMGIPVDALTMEDIVKDVPNYLSEDKKMTLISVNPQIVTEAAGYPEIVAFIKQSTHRIPDGIGIVLVSKLTGGPIKERVAGYDLMLEMLAYANRHQKSIFLYGAKPNVLKDTDKHVREMYPNLRIVGMIDGYVTSTDEEIVKQINAVSPDFLFVALGFPRQEQFLAKHFQDLNVHIFQDVGGSFDVLSGHVKRAPDLFIKWHLEWLYRSVSNPTRIGRMLQLPVFLGKSLYWNYRNKTMRWTNGD
ncbi:N-acetylglucosaminyldiphosphoundecaprenol N-acetyl-beta-D-mannosaminyltransferase [Enterococcus sp. AZ095a]|uniref:WecB/TagA/CpsF family glycosyltransferase n=1 Tax=Enterococcus sp. AZ095a TaxID=2774718 RepID=UPI003D2FE86E